jgi:catechol 2,3-dioxygenase-like lactoylglutathione lyase family enzyme
MTRPPFEISGFDEAVLIVRDERVHLDCWLGQGAWELRHEGAVDPRLLQAWGRPGATGREWLLAHPDCKVGRVRLMKLEGAAPQTDIRQDDQCWDTGGIFDLNVRVLGLARQAEHMRALRWQAGAPPIGWDFGALKVREWLVRGPDNVRLALIERVAPPLTGFDHIREFSQVFNSSQIVRDMESAVAFYCDLLGFQLVTQYAVPQFPPGPNLFGIPPGVSDRIGLSLVILHPQGKSEGSIELVTNPGAQGRDLSADAGPPHYGMAALRFPVRDIKAFAEQLTRLGHEPAMPLTRLNLAPLGPVHMLALRSPDGAWLEFVESID